MQVGAFMEELETILSSLLHCVFHSIRKQRILLQVAFLTILRQKVHNMFLGKLTRLHSQYAVKGLSMCEEIQ